MSVKNLFFLLSGPTSGLGTRVLNILVLVAKPWDVNILWFKNEVLGDLVLDHTDWTALVGVYCTNKYLVTFMSWVTKKFRFEKHSIVTHRLISCVIQHVLKDASAVKAT